MNKHPTLEEALGIGHEKLVEALGNLPYSELTGILARLSIKLSEDAAADEGRNRPKLAALLRQAAKSVFDASGYAGQAWQICKRHMPQA